MYLTWEVMEVYVNEILVAKSDACLILLMVRNDVTEPVDATHASQIHEHHSRVDTCKKTRDVVTVSVLSPTKDSMWQHSTVVSAM